VWICRWQTELLYGLLHALFAHRSRMDTIVYETQTR
jgi:hypothetical protein